MIIITIINLKKLKKNSNPVNQKTQKIYASMDPVGPQHPDVYPVDHADRLDDQAIEDGDRTIQPKPQGRPAKPVPARQSVTHRKKSIA
ncbi:MAG: hypothetical protein EB015_22275, partial [Methylocystaceae bacterium]|nr:hypothetical protein [Methylocystaceae bacterium]